MKIAFVDPGSFVLAHDRFFLNSIVRHVDVDFFYSDTLFDKHQLLNLHNNINRKELRISSSTASRLVGLLNYLRLLVYLFLNKNEYASIHFNWSLLPWFDQFALPFLFGDKLVYSLHNIYPHGARRSKVYPEHRLAKKCRKIMYLSPHAESFAYELNSKAKLFRHGLTLGCISPKLNAQPVDKVRFIGNVKPYKGIQYFVDLSERFSNDFQFEILGRWSDSLAGELERASGLCLVRNQFLETHFFEELFFSDPMILVLPYEDITQSGIFYNAISGCIPFIASDRGEFAILARSIGFAELLFEPGDLNDMARAFLFCVDNFQMIRNRLEQAQSIFSWDYPRYEVLDFYGS